MAFTTLFCTRNAPWLDTNGILAYCINSSTGGTYNYSISGVNKYGVPYLFTSNVVINPGATWGAVGGLLPGTYTLTVVENITSATQSYPFTIGEYPEVMAIDSVITQPACSGNGALSFSYNTGEFASMQYCVKLKGPTSCNSTPAPGSCLLTPGGGLATISKGQVVSFPSLPPGEYCIHLREQLSCGNSDCGGGAPIVFSTSFIINEPSQVPLNITISSEDTVCDTTVGSITINSIDGVGPYTYSWTGPGGFTSTDENLTGLEAGDYTLVVTDSNGCTGTITVSIASVPDQSGCVDPVICYKAVNCDPDCFGTKVYYLTGADVSALEGYIINGLDIEGEVIDPKACWTIMVTDPSESDAGGVACFIDFDAGVHALLNNCELLVNGVNIFTGSPVQLDTAALVSAIVAPGGVSGGFVATAGSTATQFDLCAPDPGYANATISISYQWYDENAKVWVNVQLTDLFGPNVPPSTGCYTAKTFLGYNTIFSTCELCKPVDCPVDPPYERVIPDPVKIFYQIREPKCDITVTKQFATAYSNMLKKIKYGITDCCNGLNIAETWVNKQLSNLQATVIPGYNCRSIPMAGCSWLPLQGCELLVTPTDGTSILVIAGEDLVYAKLVMLLGDGKAYLNQPFNTGNYQRAIGFTTMDVQMNQSTRVLVNGIITNPVWSLITGAVYYASPDGNITSTIPTVGISQMIGIAINSTTLFVDIKQPNILC